MRRKEGKGLEYNGSRYDSPNIPFLHHVMSVYTVLGEYITVDLHVTIKIQIQEPKDSGGISLYKCLQNAKFQRKNTT